MTDGDLKQLVREMYGISPEEWAAMEALCEAEARIRDAGTKRVMAHAEAVAAQMPDRLRAEGYDVPASLRFEVR